jgi:hypothetical protein
MWPRIQRWLADRTLRRAARVVDPEQLRRAFAQASEQGRLAYQGALNQHAVATGGSFVPKWMDAAAQLQAGIDSPDRRSIEWPTYGSLGRGRYPGLTNLPKPTPPQLRRFSETPPARFCIDKIKGAVTRLEFRVKPTSKQFLDRNGNRLRQLPLDMQQRIDAAERAFACPDPKTGMFWDVFLEEVIEDILVGGFGSVETHPWLNNPLQPFVLYPIQGESICINLDWLADDAAEEHRRYRYVQTPYAGGSAGAAVPYILFRDQELMYLREDPRTSTPFGLGRCEVAYEMISAWLGHMDARERKESNEIPEYLIHLGEDAGSKVDGFRFYWRHNIEGNGETPIIGGSKEPKVLMLRGHQVGEQLNAWPDMVLRITAKAFHLSSQTFNEQNTNRSTAEVLTGEEFADAVLPLVRRLEGQFTQHILRRMLGWHDLRCSFVITQGDREKEVAVARELADGDLADMNEAREHAGLEPWPENDPRGRMTLTEYRAWANARHQPEDPFGMAPSKRLGMEDEPPLPDAPAAVPGFEPGSAAAVSAGDRALAAFAEQVRAELAGRPRDGRYVSMILRDADLAGRVRKDLAALH